MVGDGNTPELSQGDGEIKPLKGQKARQGLVSLLALSVPRGAFSARYKVPCSLGRQSPRVESHSIHQQLH